MHHLAIDLNHQECSALKHSNLSTRNAQEYARLQCSVVFQLENLIVNGGRLSVALNGLTIGDIRRQCPALRVKIQKTIMLAKTWIVEIHMQHDVSLPIPNHSNLGFNTWNLPNKTLRHLEVGYCVDTDEWRAQKSNPSAFCAEFF